MPEENPAPFLRPSPPPAYNAPAAPADSDEFGKVRELLFGEELELLERLRTRLDDPALRAREVGAVLAEALLVRSGKDDRLGKALEPLVEEIVKGALRKRPLDFTSVLFPLMGPAIRRSIAESFRSMLQGLHKALEMSFSWRGLHWRLEALRTGRSFSEVVLLHTLVYRVEQIFLIHNQTGLVLAHVQNEGVEGQDADMVSAMLTAIQDFMRDCFNSADREELDSLRMGEAVILVERSAHAYLACVIRGTPPVGFRAKLRAALENMAIEYADELGTFNGDSDPFASAHRHLEDCLVTRMMEESKVLPLWIKALPVALVLALVGGLGFWRHAEQERVEAVQTLRREMQRGVDAVDVEPGIVVFEVARADSPPWKLSCMRDELARPVADVLREQGLDPAAFIIVGIPFVSYEAPIVRKRVENAIRPPSTVNVSFDAQSGILRLEGTAPMDWILESRRELAVLPGVRHLDFTRLEDPRTERIFSLVKEIEATSIEFPLGKDVPVPADQPKLRNLVDNLVALEKLAKDMDMGVSVTVYGHTDSVGQEKRNYELSQERGKTLAAMLYTKGASIPLTIYGMGAQYAEAGKNERGGDPSDRRIELKVHLAQVPKANPDLMRGR